MLEVYLLDIMTLRENNVFPLFPECKDGTMRRVMDVLLALLSRFLFAVHGIVTVWRVVVVKGEPRYWLLLMGVALLGVEMAVTIKCTRNAEWKW